MDSWEAFPASSLSLKTDLLHLVTGVCAQNTLYTELFLNYFFKLIEVMVLTHGYSLNHTVTEMHRINPDVLFDHPYIGYRGPPRTLAAQKADQHGVVVLGEFPVLFRHCVDTLVFPGTSVTLIHIRAATYKQNVHLLPP